MSVVTRQAPILQRLAYTRGQAAEALGLSRSTFTRRVLPYVATVEMPSGAKLIPVDELERLLTEWRQAAKRRPVPPARGRPPLVPADVIEENSNRTGGRGKPATDRSRPQRRRYPDRPRRRAVVALDHSLGPGTLTSACDRPDAAGINPRRDWDVMTRAAEGLPRASPGPKSARTSEGDAQTAWCIHTFGSQ